MQRQLGIGLGALLLAGCSAGDGQEGSGNNTLAGARSAIVARNYGDAAQIARRLVTRAPRDAAANFELARAEALLGNNGSALDALEAAVNAGLANVPAALTDPAFSSIRTNDRFVILADRASPAPADPTTQQISAGNGSDRVEIINSNGRSVVRAGDVELDGNF